MGTTAESPAVPARLETAAETAARLRVTRATIYNLMGRGMPSLSIGRARRFRPAEVDAWLDAQQAEAAA